MNGRPILVVAALVVLTATPRAISTLPAAQDPERHVFVTVLDGDGNPIAGLTAAHFAVREGGRDREVLRLEPLETPMHVSVLVDTTIGGGTPDEGFRSAIEGFLARLTINHQVALYAFGNRAALVHPFTQDGGALRRAMTGIFAATQGGSYLIDAIDLALADMKPIEPARPVIVAITSETADASRRTAGGVIKELIKQTTAFHSVVLATATGSGTASRITRDIPSSSQRMQGMIALGEGDRERTQALQQGTSLTGGSLQRVTNVAAVAPALTRLTRELGSGYRLTFSRRGSDPLKDLQVGVMLDGVALRATPSPRSPK